MEGSADETRDASRAQDKTSSTVAASRIGPAGKRTGATALSSTLCGYSGFRSYRAIHSESWPGLSRPSTPFSPKPPKKDVDARDKRGHDGGEAIQSHGKPL